jgi:N-acyl-D-amino-acid deacylase
MKLKRSLAIFFGAALCAMAQFPDFTPPTPLMGAVMRNDTREVKRMLDAGADPNEGRFLGASPLFLALMRHNADIAEVMIAKGANVMERDGFGSTTLMWAAYDEAADPALVRKFLALGVDPNAKNKSGETALVWAMRRGHTPVVEVLRQAGASDRELVKSAVEKAIALLEKSGPQFVKVSGCTSCHHQSLPQMAYSAARARGFAVDEKNAEYQVKAVLATFKPVTADMAAGKPNIPDPAISVSYALVGLAAEGYAPNATTAAMAHLISLQQTADGSFLAFPARPPIESSAFTATALSIRALQVYGKSVEQSVERARHWLESAHPQTTEDRAMQLLGLTWAKAGRNALAPAARELLKQQRPDGGWGQLTGLESDAYATGQVLAALRISGQLEPPDSDWRKGVGFLLRTQLDDGSWLVRSRTVPFQPYKESGFPHGKNQWISASGTSWAVLALSLGEPAQTESAE